MRSFTGTVASAIYSSGMAVAGPFLPLYLRRREQRGKENAARINERFGNSIYPRPEGQLLWVHGASVGETLSSLPLIRTLLNQNPDLYVVITSGTVTSASVLAEKLPPRALHQFVPLDTKKATRAFLDHWQPNAVLWLESELWPRMLSEIKSRDIPAALLNARMSEASAKRWRCLRGFARDLLSTFSVILAQSGRDSEHLRRLLNEDRIIKKAEREAEKQNKKGVPSSEIRPRPEGLRVRQAGNLKFTAPAPVGSPDSLSQLLARFGTRPRWIMASTHEGEEGIAAQVHLQLVQRWPDLLTIIVPRHPDRAPAILSEITGKGVAAETITQRSLGTLPHRDTEIYLADTIGELGTLYGAAPIACVGGSFSQKGGHNPIEPAQCGCAVVAGPDMSNFSDIASSMIEAEALTQVKDTASLTEEIAKLISDYSLLTKRQGAARRTTNQQERVLASIMKELAEVLARGGIRTA